MQNFHILCICPRLDPTGGYQIKLVGGVRKKVGGVNPPEGGVEKSLADPEGVAESRMRETSVN